MVGHICDENKIKKGKTWVRKMQDTEEKYLNVAASNLVISSVEINVGQHMQSCDVEEDEWIQVTDRKNKMKALVEPVVDRAAGDISNHGAGIPLNPIVGK